MDEKQKEKLKNVKMFLRSSLLSKQEAVRHGITERELLRDYEASVFERVPFKEFGFNNLESFCRSIPDVVSVIRGPDGPLYKPVVDESTANIAKLVKLQRPAKKPPGRRNRVSREPLRRPSAYSKYNATPNGRNCRFMRPNMGMGYRPPPLMPFQSHFSGDPRPNLPFIRVQFPGLNAMRHNAPNRAVSMPGRTQINNTFSAIRVTVPNSDTFSPLTDVKFGDKFEVPPRFKNRNRTVQVERTRQVEDTQQVQHTQQATANEPIAACRPPTPKSFESSKDYKSMLNVYAQTQQIPKAKYETVSANRYGGWISNALMQARLYGSVDAYKTKMGAEQAAAMNACIQLRVLIISETLPTESHDTRVEPSRSATSEEELKARVCKILEKKSNGLWNTHLAFEYKEAFGEEAPQDLLALVSTWSDRVTIESIPCTERKILYPVAQTSHKLVQSNATDSYHIPPAVLPATGSKIEAYTCFLRNPGYFFVHLVNSPIIDLENSLTETYGSRGSPKELQNATPGTFCVSKFDNKSWCRGQVLSAQLKEHQMCYEVFYVDHGNSEHVSHLRVKRILENHAQAPAQALRCRMSHVYPKGATWTDEDVVAFSEIYDFNNKQILLSVVSVQGDCCEVLVYDGQDIGRCLNKELVESGIAVDTLLPPEPELIELPSHGDWHVFLSYVDTACDVTIRLVGQDYSFQLEAVEESLADLENVKFEPGEPKVHSIVAVKFLEDTEGHYSWCRCRVMAITDTEAKVHFLDHHDNEVVAIDCLRPLLPKYNQLPYQAVCCKLTGLEPYADDDNLLAELKSSALGKTLVCEVDERLDTIKVTLYDTSTECDVNINTSISEVLMVQDLAPKIPAVTETIEGFVSHVTDDGRVFFNILGPGLQKLEEMLGEIDSIYSKIDSSRMMARPEVGDTCVAKYIDGEVEGWYRAVIHQLSPNIRKAVVYFVDYGNSQSVSYANLRVYAQESKYLKILPFQAIECKLYGLPPPDCSWTPDLTERVTQLCPIDELRILEVVRHDADEVPEVEIYRQNEQSVLVAVSEVLAAEGAFASEIGTEADSEVSTEAGDQIIDVSDCSINTTDDTEETSIPTSSSSNNVQRTSPLRIDIRAAVRYMKEHMSSSKSSAPPTSVLTEQSSASSLSSLRTATPCIWGDDVPTPDIPMAFRGLLPKSPNTPKSPDLDWVPSSTTSPTDRQVVQYEDLELYSTGLDGSYTGPTKHTNSNKPLKGILKRRSVSSLQEEEDDTSCQIQVVGGDEFLDDDSHMHSHSLQTVSSHGDTRETLSYEDTHKRTTSHEVSHNGFTLPHNSTFPVDTRHNITSPHNTPATVISPKVSFPDESHKKGAHKKTMSPQVVSPRLNSSMPTCHNGNGDSDPIIDLDDLDDPIIDLDDPIIDLDADDVTDESYVSALDNFHSPASQGHSNGASPIKKNISFSENLENLRIISDDDDDVIGACGVSNGACALQSSVAGDQRMPPPLELPRSEDELYITWVESPHNFRCIPQVFVNPLSDLTQSMYTFYDQQHTQQESYGVSLDSICEGELYGVSLDSICEGELYGGFHEGLWYRVRVKRVLSKQIAVHFVDFGNYSVIKFQFLRVLPPEFRKLPFLAINARLTGVDRKGENWPEATLTRLSELILEKTLTAYIHASKVDEYVSMTLVDRSKRPEGPDQFIHDVLINEKLAVKSQYFPPSPL